MTRRLLLVSILIAAVALAACSSDINLLDETKLQDTSLLTGEPCEPPCWNGITPGETSYRDAKLIIEGDERFKISEEPDPQADNPARVFTFAEGENQPCCQVISGDGETVTSFLLQLAPVMSYGPVFDRYGEPELILGQTVSEEQAYVILVYPDLPLIMYAFVEGGEQGKVSVNNKIIGVMYMSEDEVQELHKCLRAFFWRGFEPLSTYVDGEYDYVGDSVGDEDLCKTN